MYCMYECRISMFYNIIYIWKPMIASLKHVCRALTTFKLERKK